MFGQEKKVSFFRDWPMSFVRVEIGWICFGHAGLIVQARCRD